MNITEDYVSFEIAKLLKEKGFDEPCYRWYDTKGDVCAKFIIPDIPLDYSSREHYLCPSLSMAMKWLREVHKLSIEPYSIAIDEKCVGYAYSICSCDNGIEMFAERWDGKNPFTTYEQAVKAALKYSLENLI